MEYLQRDFRSVCSLVHLFTTWCGLFQKSWHLERNLEKFWRHFQDIFFPMISKNIPIESENWKHVLKNKIRMYIVSLESLVLGVARLCSSCVWGEVGPQMHNFWIDVSQRNLWEAPVFLLLLSKNIFQIIRPSS